MLGSERAAKPQKLVELEIFWMAFIFELGLAYSFHLYVPLTRYYHKYTFQEFTKQMKSNLLMFLFYRKF
jgi:hypothetical protein